MSNPEVLLSHDAVNNVPLPRSPQQPYSSLRAWFELFELERKRSKNEQPQTNIAAALRVQVR